MADRAECIVTVVIIATLRPKEMRNSPRNAICVRLVLTPFPPRCKSSVWKITSMPRREVSAGLGPPEPIEAGCLQCAWKRFLTRVESLKNAFGQILPAALHTADQLWKELRRGVGSTELLFTIQADFEAGLRLPGQGAGNFEELNAKFSLWLQSVYHVRVHSSTGMTPTERYQRRVHLVKALDPHADLDQLFYHQLTRTVRRDGTIRLGNQLYEIDLSLCTLQVQLRFDPFKLNRIEVTHRGASFGLEARHFMNAPTSRSTERDPSSVAGRRRARGDAPYLEVHGENPANFYRALRP